MYSGGNFQAGKTNHWIMRNSAIWNCAVSEFLYVVFFVSVLSKHSTSNKMLVIMLVSNLLQWFFVCDDICTSAHKRLFYLIVVICTMWLKTNCDEGKDK